MVGELKVEMRALRAYQQGPDVKGGGYGNDDIGIGISRGGTGTSVGLPRRRSYYWLLTYRGRHRRSTAFYLPPEGLWPLPLGVESFQAEWGPVEKGLTSGGKGGHQVSASAYLQVDLFETGPAGPGPARSRGHGTEEEALDDQEAMETYSIYDFNVSRVACARIELEAGHGIDRWYHCTTPGTGEVIWGLVIRVATWVNDSEIDVRKRQQESPIKRRLFHNGGKNTAEANGEEEEDEEEGSELLTPSSQVEGPADPTPPSSSSSSASSPSSSPPISSSPHLRDQFGFPVAAHAEAEYRHLRNLEQLRAIEQRLRWDKVKLLRPSFQKRRSQSALDGNNATLFAGPIGSAVTPPRPSGLSRNAVSCSSATSSISSSGGGGGGSGLRGLGHERAETGDVAWLAYAGGGIGLDGGNNLEEEGSAALKVLIWDGVPTDLREQVYQWLSGAQAKREAMGSNYYSNLAKASKEDCLGLRTERIEDAWVCVSQEHGTQNLDGGLDVSMPALDEAWGAKVAQEIELDLGRAFAEADSIINRPKQRAMLRRVLRAYALRNPAVGYCQGMNFIAALLLLVVQEETAFWSLAHICEAVSPLCFSPPLLGTRADMRALADLLESELPDLYTHFLSLHLHLEMMAGHWLLVYFINVFPPPVALRVLEVSMAEGSDITFAVALAFLKGLEAELLACDDLHEVSTLLRTRQVAMYDVDALLYQARAQLRTIRSRLRISRAWHLGDLIKFEAEQRSTRISDGGSSAYLVGRGYERMEDQKLRRFMRRSLARGLSLVGLSYWIGPRWRSIDQLAFQATHRLLLEGRGGSLSIAPTLVTVLSWLMNWPTMQRGPLVGGCFPSRPALEGVTAGGGGAATASAGRRNGEGGEGRRWA